MRFRHLNCITRNTHRIVHLLIGVCYVSLAVSSSMMLTVFVPFADMSIWWIAIICARISFFPTPRTLLRLEEETDKKTEKRN